MPVSAAPMPFVFLPVPIVNNNLNRWGPSESMWQLSTSESSRPLLTRILKPLIAQPPSSSDVPVPPADTPPLKAQKAQTRRQVTTHSREDYMTQSDRPDFHSCTQRMVSAYVDTVDGTVQDGMNTRSCPLLPNAQDLVPSPAASNDLSPYLLVAGNSQQHKAALGKTLSQLEEKQPQNAISTARAVGSGSFGLEASLSMSRLTTRGLRKHSA